MKNYTNKNPVFSDTIEIMETTDTNHAENVNVTTRQLLDNTLYLKKQQEEDKVAVDEELNEESENPIKNAAVAAALIALTEEINKIKEMLPSLAAPTAEDAGKVLKIDADGNAVWAEDYGASLQAKYPEFYAPGYDTDIDSSNKHIETVYTDGYKAVVDFADDGSITQTLYNAANAVEVQRVTTFSNSKKHIEERKVDTNGMGEADLDSGGDQGEDAGS